MVRINREVAGGQNLGALLLSEGDFIRFARTGERGLYAAVVSAN